MTPAEVLATLRALRIEVRAEGGRLRLRAPVGTLTPELRHAVEVHKPGLLALLSGVEGPAASVPAPLDRPAHLQALLRQHFRKLNALRADWAGAHGRIERTDIPLAACIERAWRVLDREARRFVRHEVATDELVRAALAAHASVWQRAFRLLDDLAELERARAGAA